MTYSEGTTVGPYEIRQHLGSGGMGEVYRASDRRLSRDVAIKIVSRLDPSHAARFDAEVRAVAALTHPHIVSIFDVGEIDGRPYAVMEMLDGETLRARINRVGALAESEVVAFGLQIASALDAAHARQIVHRDVKPENIFVLRTGTVKLVDFGLAAAMRPEDITVTRLTAQGLVVGTVGYMAPEQARGAAIDARADVFSCGAVLFEMATSRPAFPGSSAVEILTAIISGVRPSFSGAPVSPWLQSVIVRCLDSDPSARFRSAAELHSALQHGLTAAPRLQSEERPAPLTSIAVLPFADMSRSQDQDYLCQGIAEELITALSHISGLKVASRTAAFRFRGSVDVSEAGLALGVACVLEGSVRTAGDRLRVTTRLTQAPDGYLLWSHQFDRGLDDIFAVQDEIARTVVQTLRPAQPPASTMIETATETTEAYTEYLKGRFHWNRRTEKDIDAAVGHFSRSIAIEPSFARGHAGLGDALATQGLYGLRRPADVMPQAKASALRAVELNSELADGYVPLALVEAVYEWAWGDSERHFLKASALARDDSWRCIGTRRTAWYRTGGSTKRVPRWSAPLQPTRYRYRSERRAACSPSTNGDSRRRARSCAQRSHSTRRSRQRIFFSLKCSPSLATSMPHSAMLNRRPHSPIVRPRWSPRSASSLPAPAANRAPGSVLPNCRQRRLLASCLLDWPRRSMRPLARTLTRVRRSSARLSSARRIWCGWRFGRSSRPCGATSGFSGSSAASASSGRDPRCRSGGLFANQSQHLPTHLDARPPDGVGPGRIALQAKRGIVREQCTHRFDAAAAEHRAVRSVDRAGRHRTRQRRDAAVAFDGGVGSVREQQVDERGVGIARCQQQGRRGLRAGDTIRIGAAVEQ